MFGVARAIFWLALVVWLGEVVCFSFVVAPAAFATLPQESAGLLVGAVLSRYYIVGAFAGLIALVAALMLRTGAGAAMAWSLVSAMLVLMLAATLYAGWVVYPRAQVLRPRLHEAVVEPGTRLEFDRLHLRAVRLNAAVLLLGIVTVCVASGSRPLPPG